MSTLTNNEVGTRITSTVLSASFGNELATMSNTERQLVRMMLSLQQDTLINKQHTQHLTRDVMCLRQRVSFLENQNEGFQRIIEAGEAELNDLKGQIDTLKLAKVRSEEQIAELERARQDQSNELDRVLQEADARYHDLIQAHRIQVTLLENTIQRTQERYEHLEANFDDILERTNNVMRQFNDSVRDNELLRTRHEQLREKLVQTQETCRRNKELLESKENARLLKISAKLIKKNEELQQVITDLNEKERISALNDREIAELQIFIQDEEARCCCRTAEKTTAGVVSALSALTIFGLIGTYYSVQWLANVDAPLHQARERLRILLETAVPDLNTEKSALETKKAKLLEKINSLSPQLPSHFLPTNGASVTDEELGNNLELLTIDSPENDNSVFLDDCDGQIHCFNFINITGEETWAQQPQ